MITYILYKQEINSKKKMKVNFKNKKKCQYYMKIYLIDKQ